MNLIKKCISVFLCMALIVIMIPQAISAAGETEPKIILSDETAKPGENVTVAVDIFNNPGLMVMMFNISYDHTQLSLTGAEGAGLTGWDVSGDTVLWLGDADNNFNGRILLLNFRVSESASSGKVTVTLTFGRGDIGNHDEKAFFPTVSAGSVTVKAESSSGGQGGSEETQPPVPQPPVPQPPVPQPPVPQPPVPQPPETQQQETQPPEPPEPDIPFTDVYPDTYYYTAVVWAYQNNVTNGRSKDTFDPMSTCTRGEVVTFLWRAAGCPEPKIQVNPFEDIKADDYYFKPVLWAIEKGITFGTDQTHFSPRKTCATAHIITFIYRALEIGTDGWYRVAGDWANGSGLLNDTGLLVDPAEDCPRCAVVTFLYRWTQLQEVYS